MSRVLVTGASGFIGRAAVAALRDRSFEVHAVARAPVAEIEADAWHRADLLDPAAAGPLVRTVGASHLLHLAWTTEHGAFWSDPANLEWSLATVALFEAFGESGGARAVLAGSCAQYDWSPEALGPSAVADESESPRRPATLYGTAKEETAAQLEAWAPSQRLSYATALLFFPYGPFDDAARLVPSLTHDLAAGRSATVRTGAEVRDFIHVDDCGAALAAIVESDITGSVNVGTGQGSSVAEVAGTVARILGREELLRVDPPGETASTVVASVYRLRDEVGFVPRYDLESGLRQTVDWLLSERGAGSRPERPSAEASR
jgi:nucleoside-diphosphate-sugar epimerase